MEPTCPYVSIAFTNRNDGYGGELELRVAKFIDYYAHYVERWPELFEFVICDWNPPPDRPKLAEAFEWEKLKNVLHVEVPPEVHSQVAGTQGRQMLDYIGRNVSLRRSSGFFSLIVNQDIYISQSILELLAARQLSPRFFYRADRCDFDFSPYHHIEAAAFERAAMSSIFCVHRRHRLDTKELSVPASVQTVNALGSRPEPCDQMDHAQGLILCDVFGARLTCDRERARRWPEIIEPDEESVAWHQRYMSHTYHRGFLLHTNASGDFILAPRQAFFEIHGMPETTQFYFHLDTYAVVQLFAAGYDQAIFAQPHRIYHADHDRSGREDYRETISWEEHEAQLSRILRNERSYRFNDKDWGLGAYELPTTRIRKP